MISAEFLFSISLEKGLLKGLNISILGESTFFIKNHPFHFVENYIFFSVFNITFYLSIVNINDQFSTLLYEKLDI